MPKGGARPGAGRKRKATLDEHKTRRDMLLKVINPARWEKMAEQVAQAFEAGDIYCILPYLPYILGSPRQEINVSGEITHVELQSARKVLRVVGEPLRGTG